MNLYKPIFYMLFVVLLMLSWGCTTDRSASQPDTTSGEAQMTLEDHLRRINGIQIKGQGDYAKVFLTKGSRGISNVSRGMGEPKDKKDINLSDSDKRQPLFVIDGQKVGRNYPDIRDMFAPGEIKTVKLLSDSEAARYGSESGSGVIVIKTKSESQ